MERRPINTFVSGLVKDEEVMGKGVREAERARTEREGEEEGRGTFSSR